MASGFRRGPSPEGWIVVNGVRHRLTGAHQKTGPPFSTRLQRSL